MSSIAIRVMKSPAALRHLTVPDRQDALRRCAVAVQHGLATLPDEGEFLFLTK